MPREIFIVARDRPDLYRYLSQTFSDADNVQVIWDRRNGDRRATSATAHNPERRQGDRRRRAAVDQELRLAGSPPLTNGGPRPGRGGGSWGEGGAARGGRWPPEPAQNKGLGR